MKRAIAAAIALLTVGGFTATDSVAGMTARPDAVTGSAKNAYPTPAGPGDSILAISARSGPAGQDPTGVVSANGTLGVPMGAFAVSGPVTCLRISGNKASIKYRFTRATGSAATLKGGGVEVFVEDNGHLQHGRAVDAAAFDPPLPAAAFNATATQCDDPNLAAYNTVESGDYTVNRHAAGVHVGTRSHRAAGHRLDTERRARGRH